MESRSIKYSTEIKISQRNRFAFVNIFLIVIDAPLQDLRCASYNLCILYNALHKLYRTVIQLLIFANGKYKFYVEQILFLHRPPDFL